MRLINVLTINILCLLLFLTGVMSLCVWRHDDSNLLVVTSGDVTPCLYLLSSVYLYTCKANYIYANYIYIYVWSGKMNMWLMNDDKRDDMRDDQSDEKSDNFCQSDKKLSGWIWTQVAEKLIRKLLLHYSAIWIPYIHPIDEQSSAHLLSYCVIIIDCVICYSVKS